MPLADIPLGALLRLRDGQIVHILVRHPERDRATVRNEITGRVFITNVYRIAEVIA